MNFVLYIKVKQCIQHTQHWIVFMGTAWFLQIASYFYHFNSVLLSEDSVVNMD